GVALLRGPSSASTSFRVAIPNRRIEIRPLRRKYNGYVAGQLKNEEKRSASARRDHGFGESLGPGEGAEGCDGLTLRSRIAVAGTTAKERRHRTRSSTTRGQAPYRRRHHPPDRQWQSGVLSGQRRLPDLWRAERPDGEDVGCCRRAPGGTGALGRADRRGIRLSLCRQACAEKRKRRGRHG